MSILLLLLFKLSSSSDNVMIIKATLNNIITTVMAIIIKYVLDRKLKHLALKLGNLLLKNNEINERVEINAKITDPIILDLMTETDS